MSDFLTRARNLLPPSEHLRERTREITIGPFTLSRHYPARIRRLNVIRDDEQMYAFWYWQWLPRLFLRKVEHWKQPAGRFVFWHIWPVVICCARPERRA